MNFLLKLALLIATLLCLSNARQVPDSEILKTLFGKNYDHNTRPVGSNTSLADGGPVLVTLQLYVRSLEFNDEAQELRTQLTIRQKWKDSRLAFTGRYNKSAELPNEVRIAGSNRAYTPWRPDIFLSNEKRSSQHTFGNPNELTIVGKDGLVMFSSRVSVDFFCTMNFHGFPKDKNTCAMEFASYGFTVDDIVYQWNESPIEVKSRIDQQSFNGYRFTKETKASTCGSATTSGTYSCLRAELSFQRVDIQPLVVHLYLPTALLVIISWISFFLPKKELVGRLLLILIPLLLVILIARNPLIKSPATGYNKGDDTWFIWCLIFLFAALLQFLLVTIFHSRDLNTATESQKTDNGYKCCPSGNQKSDVCDFVARFLFPLAFVVFLVAYFAVYA